VGPNVNPCIFALPDRIRIIHIFIAYALLRSQSRLYIYSLQVRYPDPVATVGCMSLSVASATCVHTSSSFSTRAIGNASCRRLKLTIVILGSSFGSYPDNERVSSCIPSAIKGKGLRLGLWLGLGLCCS